MKTFAEFKETMKDETFRKEMAAFMEGKKPLDKAAELEAIAAFAADKGFTVTVEDLGQEIAGSKELSDDEIESVAGGEWCPLSMHCYIILNTGYCFGGPN